jgi:outer membrane protein TolC
MHKIISTFLILFFPFSAFGGEDVLDQYISEGLHNNLALQQQKFSLDKSLEALKEAKGLFLPNVSIQARYSRAGGGRIIEFPVGDMMNPVYQSLNQLFSFHGITAYFPSLANEHIPFLREKEHDTKIRITQPLFQPAILYNYKIKKNLSRVDRAKLSVFKRHLISDIKNAYFNYLKTLNVVDLLAKTRKLLLENQRVSENLFNVGKATEDVVFRARAEIADLDQKISEAEKNRSLAASYFNFLLNRELDEAIKIQKTAQLPINKIINVKEAITHALTHRDEFQQIQHALSIRKHEINLAGSGSLPSLTAVVDFGFQGEEYRIGKDDDYWMASLVFEWTLFNGSQTRSKKMQAALEKQKLELQRSELEKQIRLQVRDQYHALLAAEKAVEASQQREHSAKKSFEIVTKKYENGMAPQIEYLDARTTHTNASINSILAGYDYLIQRTNFEQAAGLIDLSKYERKKS